MNGSKILVVDDAYSMRELIKEALMEEGFIVVGEAKNGKEAIEMYKKLKPDVVTMDIDMPEMDGLEATKEIVKFDNMAKIIIVTEEFNRKAEAEEAGALEYLTKPFQPAFLWRKIDELLELEDEVILNKRDEIQRSDIGEKEDLIEFDLEDDEFEDDDLYVDSQDDEDDDVIALFDTNDDEDMFEIEVKDHNALPIDNNVDDLLDEFDFLLDSFEDKKEKNIKKEDDLFSLDLEDEDEGSETDYNFDLNINNKEFENDFIDFDLDDEDFDDFEIEITSNDDLAIDEFEFEIEAYGEDESEDDELLNFDEESDSIYDEDDYYDEFNIDFDEDEQVEDMFSVSIKPPREITDDDYISVNYEDIPEEDERDDVYKKGHANPLLKRRLEVVGKSRLSKKPKTKGREKASKISRFKFKPKDKANKKAKVSIFTKIKNILKKDKN